MKSPSKTTAKCNKNFFLVDENKKYNENNTPNVAISDIAGEFIICIENGSKSCLIDSKYGAFSSVYIVIARDFKNIPSENKYNNVMRLVCS
jgi:hypothetical protein